MGRPKKNKEGLTGEWSFTTLRVPRWVARQLRDEAARRSLPETWLALLHPPRLVIPNPVPVAYPSLAPFPGLDDVVLSGTQKRVFIRVVDGSKKAKKRAKSPSPRRS